jgi:hypothetical protein
MNLIGQLKRDKPTHVYVIHDDQEDPEVIPVLRGNKKRGTWQRIEKTLDTLEWDRVETRDSKGQLIGAYPPPAAEEDKEQEDNYPHDPRADLPDDPDVAKYKVLTSTILTALEPYNRLAEISFGKQDQLFEMVLIQMKEMQEQLNEARKQLHEVNEKTDQTESKMNTAMEGFLGVLKAVAPQLTEGLMASFAPKLAAMMGDTTDGGNGVPTGTNEPTE